MAALSRPLWLLKVDMWFPEVLWVVSVVWDTGCRALGGLGVWGRQGGSVDRAAGRAAASFMVPASTP